MLLPTTSIAPDTMTLTRVLEKWEEKKRPGAPEQFRYPVRLFAQPEALLARDKVNLDIFWLKDDALDDPDLLPPPDEVAAEIVESLETALERFRGAAKALGEMPV